MVSSNTPSLIPNGFALKQMMLVRSLQSLKAPTPMGMGLFAGRVRLVRPEQPENALSPMVASSGMVMFVRLRQPEKASAPMSTPSERVMSVRL